MSFIRRLVVGWRFRHMTRHFDQRIAYARKKHMPVNHIKAAKTAFVHAALRGEF